LLRSLRPRQSGDRPQPRVERSETLGSREKAIRSEGAKDSWALFKSKRIDWVGATAANLSLRQSGPLLRYYPGLRFAPPWAEVFSRFAAKSDRLLGLRF
jgi:hypothetical protein